MKLRQGSLVVFEGIDAAGKSTQIERMKTLFPDEHYTHSPSGGSDLGQTIYEMTETATRMAPVTRQFLHLAAHAEMYEREVIPWLATGGVFLDRCWWSALAYGWYSGGLKYLMDLDDFIKMVRLPTQGINPSVVFVFLHAHEQDPHNTVELVESYEHIANMFSPWAEPIYIGTEEEVSEQIAKTLRVRGLTQPMPRLGA